MSVSDKVKSFFNKVKETVFRIYHSEKVTKFRHDFKDFIANAGETVYEDVLKPFIIEQIKLYAKKTLTGDMKFKSVRENVKNNFRELNLKDYLIDTLIQDIFFELKVTKKI